MTTSNTTTFNPVRDTIIKRSLRLVNGYPATGTPRPEQIIDARETMNMMLKTWQMDDFRWLKQTAYLFLSKGQRVYNLAPSTVTGFSHCATDYVETTITADAAIGAGSVELDSATGITTGDYIGIENDDEELEWFTVTLSGTTASLSGTLAVACSDGNIVYAHTVASQTSRPTRLTARRLTTGGYEVPLEVISRSDYDDLTSKGSEGKIVWVYYDPQLESGKLYTWPTPSDCGDKIVLTMDRPIHDVVSDTQTYDLPIEWVEAMTYGLAVRLAPEYRLPLNERSALVMDFQAAYNKVLNYNREETSVFFEVR